MDEASGEKHIADVKTPEDVVIEFQRSSITDQEIHSRQAFYENLIWVIDGNRPDKLDAGFFRVSVATGYRIVDQEGRAIQFIWYGSSKLIDRWAQATCPVFYDFGGESLWMLRSYDRDTKSVELAQIEQTTFVARYRGNSLNDERT